MNYHFRFKNQVQIGVGLTASFLTNAAVNSPVFNENLEVISIDNFDLTDQIAPIELAAFLEVCGGYMNNAV